MAMEDRLNVLPTAMVKQTLKVKLDIAERGHHILKKKSESLQVHFRNVSRELIEIKEALAAIYSDLSFLMAEAKYIIGDFAEQVFNQTEKATLVVGHTVDNVAGIQLFNFRCYEVNKNQFQLAGLAKGGSMLKKIRLTYRKTAEVLVQLASLQNAFLTLDEVIKATNKRVNALEFRYIPMVENTIKYVTTEIEESSREDFFRMKKIQRLKEKQAEEKEKLLEQMAAKRENSPSAAES